LLLINKYLHLQVMTG